ncbi:MAG: Na+/H+ antiporter subunit E [Alphaproteobacteria bacterium]|nr:Na+/H+ antiporter subunit E [Alphaproteobacteria bacterium]
MDRIKVHPITLGLGLFGLWLLLSGHYDDPLLLTLGVISSIAVVFIAQRMDVIDHESVPLRLRFGFIGYLGWLAKEIILANVAVAKIIISPSLPLSPLLFRVKTSQKTDVGRVTHANSITLTPGTVSVEVEDGDIIVHAISGDLARDTANGEMDRRVTAVEGG